MSNQSNAWTGRWVADKMRTHTEIASVTLLSPQYVELVRKEHPTIVVGTTAVLRLDADILNSVFDGELALSFVVNIPKEAYITGDALRLAAMHGVPIGGLGDLMQAVNLQDVTQYVSSEFSFIERWLAQHTRVKNYQRLDDRRYLLTRDRLNEVTVVFLNEYELTADHIRIARDRYGTFDMVIITNPNGHPTGSAVMVATLMNARIHMWGEFLGALNRK